MLDLRPSPIAGTWYEGNPKLLAAQVDEYLAGADSPHLDGEVLAVIAPHAGHQYSGAVAAHAFAALRGLTPELVVVLSPFHNFSQYPLITTKHQAYSTPLGNIEVDRFALAELQANLEIPITPVANDREHSLEIELPFLQRVFTHEFKLLPVMIRSQEAETAQRLGEALGHIFKNKNMILVASTDLSHFYDQQTANLLDAEMLKRFESLDPGSIFEAEETGDGFACGRAAVASTLWASKTLGANQVKILKHATSGDVTGDFSSVVGYGAGVVLKK
ncbi:MAG: AmmeMemoRadiSam system protein B [Anaerolineales bacterium]|nr:AmmeMemoRadiSam system protein B [Anaerolineales bacterium]